ncbi:MAG: hypothetical protein L6W00_08730 [Lentisphaeria bacterium]|nr:MAG: hypothetical protein L6W00_08730 [Lentisphaeria bacterium]
MKKSDPGALVTTTGFASLVHPAVRKNFQRDVLRQARGFYDVHALHEHGGFGWYASIIDNQVLPLRRRLGVTAPWYANETAVTSRRRAGSDAGGDGVQENPVLFRSRFGFLHLVQSAEQRAESEQCRALLRIDDG